MKMAVYRHNRVRRMPARRVYVRKVPVFGSPTGRLGAPHRQIGTLFKKRVHEAPNLTNQFDVKSQYRKRYISRRKKGPWKRFSRKVRSVLLKQVGSNKVVRLSSNLVGVSAAGQCVNFSAELYGIGGSGTVADDIRAIMRDQFGGGAASNAERNDRLSFRSGVLDFYLTNTGSTSLILDAYRVVAIKDVDNVIASSINNLLNTAITNTNAPNASSSVLTATSLGLTPFQFTIFCQYFRIVNKKRFLLSGGQACSMQIRDPKNRRFLGYDVEQLFAKRGVTCGYLFILFGVPSGLTAAVATTFAYTIYRSYNYQEIDKVECTAGSV